MSIGQHALGAIVKRVVNAMDNFEMRLSWPGIERTYALDDEIRDSVSKIGNVEYQRNINIANGSV
ncbi:hypothetical protein N9B57_03530 [Verrucomicrobia bacterium]|nr:hypothetical protein [Verrucomicrobiota bacterium]